MALLDADCYPPTHQQKQAKIETFIQSIDPDAVCQLASQHHDSEPCRIFQNTANGSFNVCFFVEFPARGTRWVVRIPLVSSVYNVWDKVQSEVATIRYLEEKTKIPVPHVHAFGPADTADERNPLGLAFMIIDYIPGQSLDVVSFLEGPSERREHFYSQLIDILAELRQQEFDQAGSLMPDPCGTSTPVLGPLQSMQLNELQVARGCEAVRPATYDSVAGFAWHQFEVLNQKYQLPLSEMGLRTAQLEVFGLHNMKQCMSDYVESEDSRGPFVLAHQDLRWSNIIVDESLNIQAILDWEWTTTVPRQFFIPPTWFAGRTPEWAAGVHYRIEYHWFFQVLRSKAETSQPCQQLAQEWGNNLASKVGFVLAVMLRHHSDFLALYYRGIFRKSFKTPIDETLAQFFAADDSTGLFAQDVQQRLEKSERYTQYLKDRGLFVARKLPKGTKSLPADQEEPSRDTTGDNQPARSDATSLPRSPATAPQATAPEVSSSARQPG
ncbi:kinase-like protein [Nemania sp. NC0429]|nr:kinase-like protein [Nemania sp. NC0429]